MVAGGGNSESALVDCVTRELNRPFARPQCKPWRFSALEAGLDAHYVIVAYDHWMADSVAARNVLQHVLDRYCGWNRPENRRPLDLYPGTFREVFSHRLRAARLLSAGVHSFGQWMGNRSVAQVPYASSRQMDVRFELYRAAAGTMPQLRDFARSLGATVHDVILAALGRAVAEHLPRRATRKGQAMSLGTIVDVRGEAEEDLSDSLGAFLSYFLVRLAADEPMGLAEAVRRIAAATGPIKARRSYLEFHTEHQTCRRGVAPFAGDGQAILHAEDAARDRRRLERRGAQQLVESFRNGRGGRVHSRSIDRPDPAARVEPHHTGRGNERRRQLSHGGLLTPENRRCHGHVHGPDRASDGRSAEGKTAAGTNPFATLAAIAIRSVLTGNTSGQAPRAAGA